MEAIIERKVSVRNYDNTLLKTEKSKTRGSKMENIAGKILKTGEFLSFLIICVLGAILFLTQNLLIMKILMIIGSIFLLACLAVLVLKYTGFYKYLHLSNPIGIKATDVAIAFGVIGVFSYSLPAIYGIFFVPEFISHLQAFISNQQESTTESLRILRGLEKIFLTALVK